MFDRREEPDKILQDVGGMYGDFFLKICKVRSQMYPGIFNFRTIIGKDHFTLKEVSIHPTIIYVMPMCLNAVCAGFAKVYTQKQIWSLPNWTLLSSDTKVLRVINTKIN